MGFWVPALLVRVFHAIFYSYHAMIERTAVGKAARLIAAPSPVASLVSVSSSGLASLSTGFDPASSCSNLPWTPLATSTATSTPVFPPVDTPEPVFEAVQPDLSGDYSLVLAIWLVAAAVVVPCLLRAVQHARATRERAMCLTIAHEPEQPSTVLPELAVDDWRLFKAYVSSELPAIEAPVFDSAPGPVHKALWALSTVEYWIEVERDIRVPLEHEYSLKDGYFQVELKEQRQRLKSIADKKLKRALERDAWDLNTARADNRALREQIQQLEERIQQLEASDGRPRRRVGSSIAVLGSASRRTVSTRTQTDVLAANSKVPTPPSSPDVPPQVASPHESSTDLLSSLPGTFPSFPEEKTPSAVVLEAVDDRQPEITIAEADVQTFAAEGEPTEAALSEAVDDRQPGTIIPQADVQTFTAGEEATEAVNLEAVDDRQPEIPVAEADVQTLTAVEKVAEAVDPEAVDDRQSEIATPEADVQEMSRILSDDDVTRAPVVTDDEEPKTRVHFAPDMPVYSGKGKKSMLPEPDETQQPLDTEEPKKRVHFAPDEPVYSGKGKKSMLPEPGETQQPLDTELVNQAKEMVVDNESGAERQPPGDSIDHGVPEGGENTANEPVEDPMDHDGSKDEGKDDDAPMGESPEESDEDDDGDDDGDAPMREASGHGGQGDDVSQAGAHDANLAGSNAPQTNVMPSGPYTPLNASTVLPGLSMPSGPYAPLTASTMLPGLSMPSGASAPAMLPGPSVPSDPSMLPGPSVPSGPSMLSGPPDPLQAFNTSSSSGPIIWNLPRTCFQVKMPSPQAMAEFNKTKRMVESRSFERTSFSEQSPFFDWHHAMQRARDSLRPAALPHQAPPTIVPQSVISLPQPQLAARAQDPNNPRKNHIVGRPGLAMTQPQAQQSNANTSQAPAANVTGQALQGQVYSQQAQTDTKTSDVPGNKRQKSKVEEPVNEAGSATATFAIPNSRFNTNPSMAPSLTRPTIQSPFAPLEQPSHTQDSVPEIPPYFLSDQPSYTQASVSAFPSNSMSAYAPANQPARTPASRTTFPPNSTSANAPWNRIHAQLPTGQAQTPQTRYAGPMTNNELYMYPVSDGPMHAGKLIRSWIDEARNKAWQYGYEGNLGYLTELATDPTSDLKTIEKQVSWAAQFVRSGRCNWDLAQAWSHEFFRYIVAEVKALWKDFKELGEDHRCTGFFEQLMKDLRQLGNDLEAHGWRKT